MFRPQQAFAKNFKFCFDSPSGPPKNQICPDQLIRPPKRANLFGSANYLATKNAILPTILPSAM